jgi:hypothetical protein
MTGLIDAQMAKQFDEYLRANANIACASCGHPLSQHNAFNLCKDCGCPKWVEAKSS